MSNKHIAALDEDMRMSRMSPGEWLEALRGARQLLETFRHDEMDVVVVERRIQVDLDEMKVRGLFDAAGFLVSKIWRLENCYWPDAYVRERLADPWWLVKTEFGLIEIGPRKRVYSIHWEETSIRGKVTEDDVTKGDDHVHAYSIVKALEYLTALRRLATTGAELAEHEKPPTRRGAAGENPQT